jgi:hypothetical protein
LVSGQNVINVAPNHFITTNEIESPNSVNYSDVPLGVRATGNVSALLLWERHTVLASPAKCGPSTHRVRHHGPTDDRTRALSTLTELASRPADSIVRINVVLLEWRLDSELGIGLIADATGQCELILNFDANPGLREVADGLLDGFVLGLRARTRAGGRVELEKTRGPPPG